jgi:acetyl-CoA carboxylase biotin carboxylase subunit
MVSRILIANRGEIALRILRACKELGVESVVIHSEADYDSLPVHLADKAVCIGPPEPINSYLNVQGIMSAAEIAKVQAVHPGYGFLAENPDFAEICVACDLIFIGPPSHVIRLMGDKAEARKKAASWGVPVLPGSEGEVEREEEALMVAQEIGYPVLMKAVAGGGGRGMRLARDDDELKQVFNTAKSEAGAAFGHAGLYVEKFIHPARHIEVQVLADGEGKTLVLGERDCSLQRRHQKVLEEAPATISEELRSHIFRDARLVTENVGYVSAGTVEFLVDEDEHHYFIEMNTRIQVEHPVSEMVTGLDLIKEQIKIASGEPMEISQDEVQSQGWAIEFRINAEDPRTFKPSPGKVSQWILPGGPGIRVDTAVYQGYEIPPFYDSLLAKLIVHGKDREEAIARGRRALEEFKVEGIKTTIPLQQAILESEEFIKGGCPIDWLERFLW